MKSVFISYSHHDQQFADALATHLRVLQRTGLIDTWHARELSAGSDWNAVITDKLTDADVIVLLVSADFFDSSFCHDVELRAALSRWKAKRVTLIPVIVRACDWQASPLAEVQVLPRGARPVRQWPDQDEPWADVTRHLRAILETAQRAERSPVEQATSSGASEPPATATVEAPQQGAAPARTGSGRHTDRESFLSGCTPAAAPFFVFILREAVKRGHHIYWGKSGFSAGVHFPGPPERWSYVYGFPPDDFRFYFQDGAPWSERNDAAAFRKVLLMSDLFRDAGKLTLSARVDATTDTRLRELALHIFDHVDESVRRAGERPRL